MALTFKRTKKAKVFGFWRAFAFAVAFTFPAAAGAADEFESFSQVVYTETPVQSFYAYPDDVNFVPEHEFMMRADGVNYDDRIENARMGLSMQNPGMTLSFADRPSIVCRNFGCTRINERITRAFLFNSLANMFMMNQHSRIHICEADPFTRNCLSSGISFPVRVGIANAMLKIPTLTVDQVLLSTGMSRATVGMTFDMLSNGVAVRCAPATVDIVVPVNSQATLAVREFTCNLTVDGNTNVSMLFNMDYIDLDYGILGGYYSLGMQGPTMGGGTGYALMKLEFANSGVNMLPELSNRQRERAQKTTAQEGEVKTIRPGEYAVGPIEK